MFADIAIAALFVACTVAGGFAGGLLVAWAIRRDRLS